MGFIIIPNNLDLTIAFWACVWVQKDLPVTAQGMMVRLIQNLHGVSPTLKSLSEIICSHVKIPQGLTIAGKVQVLAFGDTPLQSPWVTTLTLK